MIKVLIVDDSRVVQEFLTHLFNSDPAFKVVGVAGNGEEALQAVKEKRPDVITVDINMPGMSGYEATAAIMESVPTPIVIVSGYLRSKEVASVFRAIEAGALAVVLRPQGIGHLDHEAGTRELLQTVRLMSEIKVVKLFRRAARERSSLPAVPLDLQRAVPEIQAVGIGASTGGPPVLRRILSGLPRDFPVPVFLVQHIASVFDKGLAEWLSGSSRLQVRIASHGEIAVPGHCYIAPNGFHLGVESGLRMVLNDQAPEHGVRPSVSCLFRSLAQALGPRAVGVLLTGMGRDGAEGLKAMKDNGAITIAQDKESSVIHGMPGEAIQLGAATYVLPPEEIVSLLSTLGGKTN
ncbi:MAG TPA: chemotaxis-specific protein-glutamate methyltransferase CheB [Candidatus Methanoperedens sp.]|nr:chemotaxis-specific protein-glutamate methyltransferase CheB [Candidatus Methanoperedens sp.]